MATKIDIHNYEKYLKQERVRLSKAPISDEDKILIERFVRDQSLARTLGKARKIKLLSTLRILAKKLPCEFLKITEEQLKTFVDELSSDQNYSVYTRSDFKKILKHFFTWLMQNNLHKNPFPVDWIGTSISPSELPRLKRSDMITEIDVQRLIEFEPNPRNKAILALVWDAGCRIGELGSMTIGSVHFDDHGTIVDFIGKTGKRSAFLVESTPHLLNWINLHPYRNNPDAPLWLTLNQDLRYRNRAMSYPAFVAMLKHAFRRAEVKKHYNPHLFRHSRAVWCATHNWNHVLANKMFGWGMKSSMYSYYCSLATEDLKDKMLECYGIEKSKTSMSRQEPCPRCKKLNAMDARYCFQCGMVLKSDHAANHLQVKQLEEKLHNGLMSKPLQVTSPAMDIKEALYQALKSDPEMLNLLKQIAQAA